MMPGHRVELDIVEVVGSCINAHFLLFDNVDSLPSGPPPVLCRMFLRGLQRFFFSPSRLPNFLGGGSPCHHGGLCHGSQGLLRQVSIYPWKSPSFLGLPALAATCSCQDSHLFWRSLFSHFPPAITKVHLLVHQILFLLLSSLSSFLSVLLYFSLFYHSPSCFLLCTKLSGL
jgi:hypothetical protein